MCARESAGLATAPSVDRRRDPPAAITRRRANRSRSRVVSAPSPPDSARADRAARDRLGERNPGSGSGRARCRGPARRRGCTGRSRSATNGRSKGHTATPTPAASTPALALLAHAGAGLPLAIVAQVRFKNWHALLSGCTCPDAPPETPILPAESRLRKRENY